MSFQFPLVLANSPNTMGISDQPIAISSTICSSSQHSFRWNGETTIDRSTESYDRASYIPDVMSFPVITTFMPCSSQHRKISKLSVATYTASKAFESNACRAVLMIIGVPCISISGFPGRRVELNRAGIIPTCNLYEVPWVACWIDTNLE